MQEGHECQRCCGQDLGRISKWCLEATPSFGAHSFFVHHICSFFYPSYGPAFPICRGDLPLPAMPRLKPWGPHLSPVYSSPAILVIFQTALYTVIAVRLRGGLPRPLQAMGEVEEYTEAWGTWASDGFCSPGTVASALIRRRHISIVLHRSVRS